MNDLHIIWTVRNQLASAHAQGLALALALLWLGMVYGLVDGLLLRCCRCLPLGRCLAGLVLGILPYLLSLALANIPLLVFSVIHTFAAGGDWLILWSLRKLPPGTRVEDHPSRAGCSVVDR